MISLLVALIFVVIVSGLLYSIAALLPIPAPFKNIAMICVLVICLLLILSAFGFVGPAWHPMLARRWN